MWLENISALSSRYRVYAIDFPGDINKSSSFWPIRNKTDCAAWFTEMLDGLNIDMAHSLWSFLWWIYYDDSCYSFISTYTKGNHVKPWCRHKATEQRFFHSLLLAGMLPTTKRIQDLMDYKTGKGNLINQTLNYQFTIAMQNALPRTKLFVSYIKDNELQQISVPALLLIGDQDIQYDVQQEMKRIRRH
jgi:pimeloyl-ACP methyl ester carboxylesterase